MHFVPLHTYITSLKTTPHAMFRSTHYPAIENVHVEELRSQDARRAMERECRTLRREFKSLEKDQRSLRMEHEFHSQRLDSMVVQSGALLTMISSLNMKDETCDYKATKSCKASTYFDEKAQQLSSLESENKTLAEDMTILLRRNADLELQVSTVMTQFGSMLMDYENASAKLKELKSAVASATSIEELNEWVQL